MPLFSTSYTSTNASTNGSTKTNSNKSSNCSLQRGRKRETIKAMPMETRSLARIFLGPHYYCRGKPQMLSSTSRFARLAEGGPYFLPFPLVLLFLLFAFFFRSFATHLSSSVSTSFPGLSLLLFLFLFLKKEEVDEKKEDLLRRYLFFNGVCKTRRYVETEHWQDSRGSGTGTPRPNASTILTEFHSIERSSL